MVATQELKAGDFLLRFKAEAPQYDIHGIRSIFRPAGVWKLLIQMAFCSLACRDFRLFFVGSRVLFSF